MVTRPSLALTYAGASLALDAGLAAAEQAGVRINLAVVDLSGVLLAFGRMDGAFTLSADIAVDKARTVVGFGGIASGALYAALEGEPAVRDGIAMRSGVAAFGGGIALRVGEDLVGAVGVSGGSAEQDTQVAQAAADALRATAERSIR